jgi:hypothetical protein
MRAWPLFSIALLLGCSSSPGASTSGSAGSTSSTSTSASGGEGGSGAGGAGGAGAGGSTTGTTTTSTTGPGGIDRIWGVTVDDITQIDAIVESLAALPQKPTVRVVFDKEQTPADYADAVAKLHAVAFVMGEIVDSSDVAAIPLDAYEKRVTDYVTALGGSVDLWEIGNEINGDPWLGPTGEVVPKMTGAYQIAKGLGKTTALTLYYNQDCWASPDHEMFAWTDANVPAEMKQGLDYVLVSFYEDDCNGIQPDWPSVFDKLGAMFPAAKIGFGECGTMDPAKKAEYVDRYYRTKIGHPRYIGGYFWWYFAEDMVPKSQPLWTTLASAIAGK